MKLLADYHTSLLLLLLNLQHAHGH